MIMIQTKALAQPRLYLDIDGVVIAEASPFNTVDSYGEKHAPEVVRRLGEAGLDLAWLSTWEDEALKIPGRIDGLRGGRVLKLGPFGPSHIMRKAQSLIIDQVESPSPFVWVDDHITSVIQESLSALFKVPQLLIKPDGQSGINENQLAAIEEFARLHKQTGQLKPPAI